MARTTPTPGTAQNATPTDAAAVPAVTTPDASTPTPTPDASTTTTAPAASTTTTAPAASTPDPDALAARFAAAIAHAIRETDRVTTTTPDGPMGDAIAAARVMGRHAVRRERVLTDALMAAVADDPESAPAAVAVIGALRAAIATAPTPDAIDPIALAVDRVLALAVIVDAITTGTPLPAGAPAWAVAMDHDRPTDDNADAYRAAVADALAQVAAWAVDAERLPAGAPGPVAWHALRGTRSRASGGDPIAYAVDAFPVAWDSRPDGAVVMTPAAAARVASAYAAGGYGVDGAPAMPSPGAIQNATHDGRVPGWRLILRGGERNAWGIIPADDPTPFGWAVPGPRKPRPDADADA